MYTNAMTSMIRTKLFNLDIHIHTMGNYITKFDVYVLQIIYTLASWGETTQDIITDPFKGY